MAKQYWSGDVTLNTEWAGDESTSNLPLSGGTIQKIIKDNINSKVGYVGRVDKTGQGFYVLCRDEAAFHLYEQTITEDNPFGDLEMDGVNGRFDAPFNYKMEINVSEPSNGYKSALLGSINNIIKFTAQTLDANNTPQGESLAITLKVVTEGGVENSYTAIYDGMKASTGIEYNLDGKLGVGQNTVIITAVGMNTGISAMRRITYRIIDMSFVDKFDILKRYQFTTDGTLELNVGYSLKGVGKTRIVWYFDGQLHATDDISNINPNIQNANRRFTFTKTRDGEWLNIGKHTIQMSMICVDIDSGEEFQTPIYYREFIIEETSPILTVPFILRKTSFDAKNGFLLKNEIPTIYNVKQFENTTIEYGVYYNAKNECKVNTYISYDNTEPVEITSEKLPMINNGFSELQKRSISLEQQGNAEIILRAFYNETDSIDSTFGVVIGASDMNITTITSDVALSLNAFGRSNNSADRESWTYTNEKGIIIETVFSKNEYVRISNASDITSGNTLEIDYLPENEIEEYKYIKYNDNYYIWTREFDWSNTSGWADNKLKLANGNAITIKYMPFSSDKITNLKTRGGTYEFEFETTNVYNDNAVICSICGNRDNAPGIVIYASGAELVISREVVDSENDTNSGYMKAVSTKYKSEESNRISFVITPDLDETGYRNRILKIYVNGELCGAYPYDKGTNFLNDSEITFRGSEESCVNISSIQIYERALSSNEILSNYTYFRNNVIEKAAVYKRNDIMLATNDETFDSDKLKSQLPVMMFYQIDEKQSLDDIHQEKKNKKLTRFFDVVYIDIQNPSKNFLVKNAYVTPQGTSSMNYPVKNLRLYTGKKNDAGEYYSRLFVGSNIFIDGSPNNIQWENINLETEVTGKRKYSFRDETSSQKAAAPVNCWCLKADFAESSSSHNTGTARFWNNVLKTAGFTTKAQIKAAQYSDLYNYDVRTCVDGFPIAVFYQSLKDSAPRFEGKYNFNNDKSTEDVFGFTGGKEVPTQEVKYFYIGKNKPIIQSSTNKETGEKEYACSWSENGYTDTPNTNSPLYTSDNDGNWYMLRGKELLDNPRMECWELLNSVNEIALFKTMNGFGPGDDDEKIGIVNGDNFDEAFESRYPDCGDYYHYNSLKRFGEWLVSCRYLDIDTETGESVPFVQLPTENYHKDKNNGKLSICSLTKQNGEIKMNFPGKNFYQEVNYDDIQFNIKGEGYQEVEIKASSDESIEDVIASLNYLEVTELPETKNENYEYLRLNGIFYTWLPGNVLETDSLPNVEETAYDYVLVDDVYYIWSNVYKLTDFHETQWVEDNAFNRALKFAVEKYDHIDMEKMAAYYIYLMRFGGVDQTVKNSMLTTEGPATDDPLSTLPSLWYFINYDNDTILGVKNDGRLVFDPYITRQTKDGSGYVYAGRESTLWNNLENDVQFMETVTRVDNILAKGEGNSLYALSYNNAIREYDTNQSDKWCERIYNKDAERKYIQTYVEGWTQRNDAEGTVTENVYEDYLYDVHGSRSAHRKWWLGRRFNVFDSRFCNDNFKNSLIKFRSTNLPAGADIVIKSGEPIFYAWGHDNSVTEMTPTAIQPGDTYTFTTKSAFNIGSYIELMGAANIATLDLRDCVGALTEIDITGCYSYSVGTKMKEIYIGDYTRTDLINEGTAMKFSGLDKASKLEYLDITNIKNIISLDGLDTLLNIREVYAEGSSIANFTFADGSLIETLRLPQTIETLSLTKSSNIHYNNISFEKGGYGNLKSLTINNCAHLMNNPDFVLNWIENTPLEQRKELSLNLQGINWVFNDTNMNRIFLLEEVGISGLSTRNIRGTIQITDKINAEIATRLQNIFGADCFKEGSLVYIKAPTAIYMNAPLVLWEGDAPIKCDIIAVGTTLSTNLDIIAKVKTNNGEELFVKDSEGDIVVDESNINNGYLSIIINENKNDYKELFIDIRCQINNITYGYSVTCNIKKRIYPESVEIRTASDSFNNTNKNNLNLIYSPDSVNDLNLIGRGFFNVYWFIETGTTGYNKVTIFNENEEIAQIQAAEGFDGKVIVKAIVTRIFDGEQICEATKELEFTDPSTIITELSNKPLYDILVKHNIITVIDGFGKLNKTDASQITMEQLIDKQTGKSIFAGNKELVSFVEFEWFNNTLVGDNTTPDGMFEGCTSLREIALSDNFKYSAKNMFNGCTNLEHIYGASLGKTNQETSELIYTSLALKYVGENFANGCKKLSTCKLSSVAEYIGATAFKNCESLTNFILPSNSQLEIIFNTSDTPFSGCKNIIFTGTDYDETRSFKYRVKNGACLKLNSDNTIDLIHMGKNTLISDIPTDKTVYARAYSMESRNELDVVIPDNIIFDGYYIFNNSTGNSIKLTKKLEGMNCLYLFANTNYGKNYHFVSGETYIPQRCFNNVQNSNFNEYSVPEGIIRIGNEAFNSCSSLEKIILPSTLQVLGSDSFWLCKSLKTIEFRSATPPSISTSDFFNVMLDNIYVKPEYYDIYKEGLMYLIRPFVKPISLYDEGFVRIIKDAQYLICDDENIVTIGDNISVVQQEDYYMKYNTESEIHNLNVYLNGEKIGEINGKYTTLYLGDNSSLYKGDGFNFTKGVYNNEIKKLLEDNGWFYDVRFEGIRNGDNHKEITFDLPESYNNKQTSLMFGQYAHTQAYSTIKNSKNNILKRTNGVTSYKEVFDFETEDGIIKFDFTKSNIHTGIDGIVINTIGNTIYSDPDLISSYSNLNSNMKNVVVNLFADDVIPFNTYVTLSDGNKYTYCKYWNGEPLTFTIPNNSTPILTVSDFISNNGKKYIGVKNIEVTDVFIDIKYETVYGIEIKDNILCYYGTDTDWFVDLDVKTSKWSENNINTNTHVDIIESSNADGIINTKEIANKDNSSICYKAMNRVFEKGVIGYIPSYIEMELFSDYLNEINEYFQSKQLPLIDLNNCWTSETFDGKNAWTSDGIYVGKGENLKYYIFGKRIIL